MKNTANVVACGLLFVLASFCMVSGLAGADLLAGDEPLVVVSGWSSGIDPYKEFFDSHLSYVAREQGDATFVQSVLSVATLFPCPSFRPADKSYVYFMNKFLLLLRECASACIGGNTPVLRSFLDSRDVSVRDLYNALFLIVINCNCDSWQMFEYCAGLNPQNAHVVGLAALMIS